MKDQVDQLVVAHAAHLPGHRGPKNDLQDATRLADELRSDRLTSVYHEESRIWELRAIVYSYLDFTEDLVRIGKQFNRISSTIHPMDNLAHDGSFSVEFVINQTTIRPPGVDFALNGPSLH